MNSFNANKKIKIKAWKKKKKVSHLPLGVFVVFLLLNMLIFSLVPSAFAVQASSKPKQVFQFKSYC